MSRLHSRTVDLAVSGRCSGCSRSSPSGTRSPIPTSAASTRGSTSRMRTRSWKGGCPTGGASYTPPGFYALAALAIRLGETLGMDTPEQLAQLLNALCVVVSGVLVLVLARLLLPGRPLARWSALAFFACSPVVLKTGAMFHPQPLAMLLSLLALTTTAWMIARRDYRLRLWAALAALARGRAARPLGLDLGGRRRARRARRRGGRAARAPAADRDGARPVARSRSCCCRSRGTSTTSPRAATRSSGAGCRSSRSTAAGRPSSTSTRTCRT